MGLLTQAVQPLAKSQVLINKTTKEGNMNIDLKNKLNSLALSITSNQGESSENRTYAGMLAEAIKNGNDRSVKIQLGKITSPEAEALLKKMGVEETMPATKTVSDHQNKKAPQSAELKTVIKTAIKPQTKGEPKIPKPVVPPADPKSSEVSSQKTVELAGKHDTEPRKVDSATSQEIKRDIIKTPPVEMIDITKIKIKPVFSNLFDRNPEIEKAIENSMDKVGAKSYKPLILCNNTLVDGHTRLSAAKAAGIKRLPVIRLEFKDEKEAVEYAIAAQTERRKLTSPELIRLVIPIHKQEKELAKKRLSSLASSDATCGKAAEAVAKRLHISTSMVERIVRLADSDNEALLKRVNNGELTIYGACKILQEKKKEEQSASKELSDADNLQEPHAEAPTPKELSDTAKQQEDKKVDNEPDADNRKNGPIEAESPKEPTHPGKQQEVPVDETPTENKDAVQDEADAQKHVDKVEEDAPTKGESEDVHFCSPSELISLITAIPDSEKISVPETFYQKLKGLKKPVDIVEAAMKVVNNPEPDEEIVIPEFGF